MTCPTYPPRRELPVTCEQRASTAADPELPIFQCHSENVAPPFCVVSPKTFGAVLSMRPLVNAGSLGELVQVCSACTCRQPRPDIGSRLAAIISERVGGAGCSACALRTAALDRMSVSEIEARLPELSREIAERAKKVSPKWWQRRAAACLPGAASAVVRRWIREAINQSRKGG